ncbi:hypothetical protein [Longispora albida]|uniref:hypothetical protein n=1 Tax=Longispora albida TaxID=203523 RepID=UPI000371AA1C|nr:hypothetical protein [Longispora albida]
MPAATTKLVLGAAALLALTGTTACGALARKSPPAAATPATTADTPAPARPAPTGTHSRAAGQDFCALYANEEDLLMKIAKKADGLGAGVDKEDAKEKLRAFQAVSPAEIRNDVTVVVTLDIDLIDGKSGAAARADSKEVHSAISHIETWTRQNCK